MEKEIKVIKDYYGEGNMYTKDKFILQSGFNVLVGCNGSGKTTMLSQIRRQMEEDPKAYVINFNNLTDGGNGMMQRLMNRGREGDVTMVATMAMSSEGEKIHQNVSIIASSLNGIAKRMKECDKDELYVLLDAVDSGLSIDNIDDVKDFFKNCLIPDLEKAGIAPFVVVVANEFEMACEENCIDVHHCVYRKFNTYPQYKKFILSSRRAKTARLDRYYEAEERKKKLKFERR